MWYDNFNVGDTIQYDIKNPVTNTCSQSVITLTEDLLDNIKKYNGEPNFANIHVIRTALPLFSTLSSDLQTVIILYDEAYRKTIFHDLIILVKLLEDYDDNDAKIFEITQLLNMIEYLTIKVDVNKIDSLKVLVDKLEPFNNITKFKTKLIDIIGYLYEDYKELRVDYYNENGKFGFHFKTVDEDSTWSSNHTLYFRSEEERDNVLLDWEKEKRWDDIIDTQLIYKFSGPNIHDIKKCKR